VNLPYLDREKAEINFENSQISLEGLVDNAGEIFTQGSTLTVINSVTLAGGGDVFFDGGQAVAGRRGATLINIDNILIDQSSGTIGGGGITLINKARGTIVSFGTIESGANTIINAGLIEAGGPQIGLSSLLISSPVDNTGTMLAAPGVTLTVDGAVTGAGQVVIDRGFNGGGKADFTSTFNEDVTFVRSGGNPQMHVPAAVLELARSQDYGGAITGFSRKGKSALDLADIGFASAGEATFSGARTSGVLTVTDGVHTARITLIGAFVGSTFTAASDGNGGTVIVNNTMAPGAAAFVAAMAGLGAGALASPIATEARRGDSVMLTRPRTAPP
jgi:hypothetical protein